MNDTTTAPSPRRRTEIKHLFLTGHPNVGKTTIIVKTVHNLACVLRSVQEEERKYDKNPNMNINIHGFYTEECRNSKGDRIGFDIIHWKNINEWWNSHGDCVGISPTTSSNTCRIPLSRSVDKIQKSDPHVGKYLVDLDNIGKHAIPTIMPSSSSSSSITTETKTSFIEKQGEARENINKKNQSEFELIILDEIGKMEMLCPNFLPAVFQTLDTTTTRNNHSMCRTTTTSMNQISIVFGTIPTPRYGRVIPAIEDIRARDDVIVLHVTKDNRDELGKHLLECFIKLMMTRNDESPSCWDDSRSNEEYSFVHMNESLEPYLYQRAIGASSMMDKESNNKKKSKQQGKHQDDEGDTIAASGNNNLPPCGPLYSDIVEPRVLLVGESASEQPKNCDLAYCERSMWKILGAIHNVKYNPRSPEEADIERFLNLKSKVLSSGICIWDVLSNVHVKKSKQHRNHNKRHKQSKQTPNPNDINGLLKKYKSIKAICFIGKKAHATFLELQDDNDDDFKGKNIDLIILPSSSAANSRMTNEEKASKWEEIFSKI